MKNKILFILALLALPAAGSRAQQSDSVAAYSHLDSLLNRYYVAMLPLDLEEKCAECDRMISECKDSLVRQWVANKIFDHYKDSPVMGEETVAVHVYDVWFATALVSPGSESRKFEASLFVDFNRNSLLYCEAPVISLFTEEGEKVTVPCRDTLSVLYFYDTSCGKCRLTSVVLPHTLDEVEYPVYLYAVYTGSDPDHWAEFRSNFSCLNPKVKIVHLWDTQVESDYQRMYGVISTPRLFLVDGSGMIIGRRLEIESLKSLLGYYSTYYQACFSN